MITELSWPLTVSGACPLEDNTPSPVLTSPALTSCLYMPSHSCCRPRLFGMTRKALGDVTINLTVAVFICFTFKSDCVNVSMIFGSPGEPFSPSVIAESEVQ